MGVKHFWSIVDGAVQQRSSEDLSGRTVVIDLNVWIVESRSLNDHHQRHSSSLRNLFFRVLNMIELNIKPIFVLESNKFNDDRFVNACSEMLNFLGFPIVKTEEKAEKLCGQLNSMNIVDFVVCDNSDCFIYGAKKVLRTFSIELKSRNLEIFDRDEIEEIFGLTRRSFFVLSLILGSDSNRKSLNGIGKENALKFLQSIPQQFDPVRFFMTMLDRPFPENKIHQKIYKLIEENSKILDDFEKILKEFRSTIENFGELKSTIESKWLKPVQMKKLEKFLERKLNWIESYTFVKVFPLLTRFQILYRSNLLEIDVNDVFSLSNENIFEAVRIKKVRSRQNKKFYEVEWRNFRSDTTLTLDDEFGNLSLNFEPENDDDEENLITIEPSDLFRHAYPEIVSRFENCQTNRKIVSSERKKKVPAISISSDSLSFSENSRTKKKLVSSDLSKISQAKRFEHRPSTAAFSTSINLELLNILDKSNENYFQIQKSKSRPIKKRIRSDFVGEKFDDEQKTINLFNTSMSLDVLNIVLRDDK